MSTERTVERPITVLHVDDDSSFLDLAEAYLERELASAEVLTANGPEEGLDRLDGSIDCVISDYDMHRMDGLEFFEAIRDRRPRLPFVLYTGKGSEEIASRAINAGVTGYFQKGGPDQYQRLANRVEHAAHEYRSAQESERYSTVLRALGYPIYVVGTDATFEYVNDAFLKLVGYDREEVIGAPTSLIKSDEGVERANEMLARIVSSNGPDTQQFGVDIHPKEGEPIPCRDHMAALPFEEEFRGSVGILRDVSEQERRRRELIRQNERLEEFVSVISHDLRSPLDMAETATELARETGEPEYFQKVATAHDRMEEMIDELLTLARTGEAVTQTDCLSLQGLAEEAHSTCAAEADLKIASTVAVEGETGRMRHLFENLIGNAVRHAGPDVTVTVGALEDEEGFYVADDGPGIPEGDRDQVFEPGFSTDDDGTGFGLAIVRRIAEAHDWEVRIEESEDGGSRFVLTGCQTVPVEDASVWDATA